jgi:hypothetical protein
MPAPIPSVSRANASKATSSHDPFPVAASRVRKRSAPAVSKKAAISQPAPVRNNAAMARTAAATSRTVQMSLSSQEILPTASLNSSHQLSFRLSSLACLIFFA